MNNNKQSVEASIVIDAPIEKVWQVLTDFENLKKWSHSFINLKGAFRQNSYIEIEFKTPMGIQKLKKHLFHFKEGRSFGWTGVFLLGMKDYHLYKLEAISPRQTKFTQTDSVSGGASFLLKGILEKQMKKGYDAFNQELKLQVETK
ncbi:SRPBCC domain-containing protein [Peijinzhouia sedimentorum]